MLTVRILYLTLAGCISVLAQTSSSLLEGIVTDTSGAPVAGVKVTATPTGTDTSYPAGVTNSDGFRVLPGIWPGEYSVSFEAPSLR